MSGRSNPTISKKTLETCLKATFESSRTYRLFTAYFTEELYYHATSHYDRYIFGRFRSMYAILGVTKVLEDVEISQRNRPLYDGMRHFLEQDFVKIPLDNSQIIRKFQDYFTARIDLTFVPKSDGGDLQILSCSDDKATILKPDWYQKNGVGYVIQSYVSNLGIVTKATVDGQIRISLRGIFIPNPEDKSKHIPYWIDYTKLTVNDKAIFDKLTPAWHDKPYRCNIDVKAGEEVKIQVEWLPHRSDT